MANKLQFSLIENWVSMTTGAFQLENVARELGVLSPEGKATLRVYLNRLVNQNILSRVDGKDGIFRPVNSKLVEMDWQKADITNYLPLLFPFDINEQVIIYPKSIICVAGSKNAGKTEFLYQFVHLNLDSQYKIDLFNSETGPEQMKLRLTSFNPPISNPPPFKTYERYENFSDVIQPDHISVIDYMDFNSELYRVGEEIEKIFQKLTTGVVIIGLQKPVSTVTYYKGEPKTVTRDLAYGGAFSAKRSVLYVSLEGRVCKLVYVKNPANPKVNPNNMQWTFQFDENGHFTNIQRKYGKDEDEYAAAHGGY